MTKLKKTYYALGAYMTLGTFAFAGEALADPGTGNNFSEIAKNVNTSITELPGLLSAVSYLMGIGLGVLGIMKIKNHVENPGQNPLKDGAIRLAAGGALFALPIVYEAMFSTIGDGEQQSIQALKKVKFTTAE